MNPDSTTRLESQLAQLPCNHTDHSQLSQTVFYYMRLTAFALYGMRLSFNELMNFMLLCLQFMKNKFMLYTLSEVILNMCH